MKKIVLSLVLVLTVVFAARAVEPRVIEFVKGSTEYTKNSQYYDTWESTDGFWQFSAFNNNMNGWDFIAAGWKTSDTTPYFATLKPVDAPIENIVITISDRYTKSAIEAATLYVADNADFINAAEIDVLSALPEARNSDMTFNVPNSVAGSYIKVQFTIPKQTSNGQVISISRIAINYDGANTSVPVEVESAEYKGTIAIYLTEEPAEIEDQKVSINATGVGTCDFDLDHFSLDGQTDMGNIHVSAVKTTKEEGSGLINYAGSATNIVLNLTEDEYIYADVDIEGTEDIEHNLQMNIHVKWLMNGADDHENTIPIEVTFNGSRYDGGAPIVEPDGSDANPYIIATAEDLCNAYQKVVPDKVIYFKQTADIDMAGVKDWHAINGTWGDFTSGIVYDGGNHVIKNFSPDYVTDGGTQGYYNGSIFGVLSGIVMNLGVVDAKVDMKGENRPAGILGAYFGHSSSAIDLEASVIRNVFVTGEIDCGSYYSGGLFGTTGSDVEIVDCYANVKYSGTGGNMGGIIGRINHYAVMGCCYVAGTVNPEAGLVAGGGVGTLDVNGLVVLFNTGSDKVCTVNLEGEVLMANTPSTRAAGILDVQDWDAFNQGKLYKDLPALNWQDIKDTRVPIEVESNDYNGSVSIYLNDEPEVIQNQRVRITSTGLGTCSFTYDNFSLDGVTNMGNIHVADVRSYKLGESDIINYEGSATSLVLNLTEDDYMYFDVDIDGTEDSDHNLIMNIHLKWLLNGGEDHDTFMPIEVIFKSEQEVIPQTYSFSSATPRSGTSFSQSEGLPKTIETHWSDVGGAVVIHKNAELRNQYGETVAYLTLASEPSTITLTLDAVHQAVGEYTIVIPAGAFTDASGNASNEEASFTYYVKADGGDVDYAEVEGKYWMNINEVYTNSFGIDIPDKVVVDREDNILSIVFENFGGFESLSVPAATYNAATRDITFMTADYGKIPISTGLSMYVRFEPVVYNQSTGAYDKTSYTVKYNQTTGTIAFPAGHGFLWTVYRDSNYSQFYGNLVGLTVNSLVKYENAPVVVPQQLAPPTISYNGRYATITAEEGAEIMMSLNWSNYFPYNGTFDVYTCKAIETYAVKDGYLDSEHTFYQVTSYGSDLYGNIYNEGTLDEAFRWTDEAMRDKILSNPNFLLYVDGTADASRFSGITNLVVNGVAERISLSDRGEWFCIQDFYARHVSYTRSFSKQTAINGGCAGWETIALPFDVQTIESEGAGLLYPFAANSDSDAHRFWLYEPTGADWAAASKIEAHKPYLIAMPNNPIYSKNYNISGDVIFSAENVDIVYTYNEPYDYRDGYKITPYFNNVYNVKDDGTRLVVNDAYTVEDDLPGSCFVADERAVRPFEAYLTAPGQQRVSIFHPTSLPAEMMAEMALRVWSDTPQTVSIFAPVDASVSVYDISGRAVRTVKVAAGDTARLTDLPAGIYIIEKTKIAIRK